MLSPFHSDIVRDDPGSGGTSANAMGKLLFEYESCVANPPARPSFFGQADLLKLHPCASFRDVVCPAGVGQ